MDVQAVSMQSAQPASGPLPSVPAAQQSGSEAAPANATQGNDPLSPVIAHIMGSGSDPQSSSGVNVSYRVERNPDMVVTVFTDPKTGAEVAQIPAETLVQLAQFFDKHSGVTLDQSV